MDQQAQGSGKISLRCTNCGARLTMRAALAGKQRRCPKCKQPITVPTVQTRDAVPEADDNSEVKAEKSSLYDLRLLDLPIEKSPPVSVVDSDSQEAAYRQLQKQQGALLPGRSDEPPTRTLPWVIDIFLYPANKAGLMVLLICVGVPFAVRLTTRFLFYAMASFGPLVIFWVLFIVMQWVVLAMALLYANWYFCECIRDSAAGAIRAVDTTANTPGLGEIFGQAVKVIAGVLLCMGPALIYFNHTRRADGAFQVLYGAGGFFVPMAVLAMAMYDALRALNPLLLLSSILKAPFQYCALVTFGYVSCVLVPMAGRCLTTPETWIQGFALLFVTLYQLLVLAHLLGRFYRRNETTLNWDA